MTALLTSPFAAERKAYMSDFGKLEKSDTFSQYQHQKGNMGGVFRHCTKIQRALRLKRDAFNLLAFL